MTHIPIPRLRHFDIGTQVKLHGDNRKLTISAKRGNGYYDLNNGAYLAVTASDGHPCEEVK